MTILETAEICLPAGRAMACKPRKVAIASAIPASGAAALPRLYRKQRIHLSGKVRLTPAHKTEAAFP